LLYNIICEGPKAK